MEGQEGEGGGAETWDPYPDCHSPATGPGPETGVWWGWAHRQSREHHGGLGSPLLQGSLSCPPGPQWGGTTCSGQGRESLGPSTGCSITGYPPHTADCSPFCCSCRGACLSAFLMLLLATLAALIALVAILGPPPRTPGQGGQERVGQTCWEGMGTQRDGGKLTLPGFSMK